MKTRRLLQSFTALATLLLLAVVTTGSVQAQDIYVNSSGGSDAACNGSSPNVATIPNCPFRTLPFALNAATSGDVIEIAAGTYLDDGDPFDFNTSITLQARNVGPNTDVFLNGDDVEINANVTFLSVGAVFYPEGDLYLSSGTMAIDAVGTWNHPEFNTIYRENGNMDGNVTNNAAPFFIGETYLQYEATLTLNQIAGNEVPADLDGGNISIDISGNGSLTFPQSFTVSGFETQTTNNANVAATGTIMAGYMTIRDAGNTHSFNAVSLDDGDYVQNGASAVSFFDLDLGANRLLHTAGSFTSTGTVFQSGATDYDGVAADTGIAAAIVHDSALNMTLNNVDFTPAATNNNASDDTFVKSIQKISGDLIIGGTVTEGTVGDGDEDDTSAVEIIVEAGTFTVTSANTFTGDTYNNGSLVFSNGSTLGGDVNNITTITIGGGTLHLAPPFAGVYTNLDDFNGSGALHIHSDGDVPVTGIDTEGNLTLAGDNDGALGAPLVVGGSLTIAGTGDWSTAGAFDIAGGDFVISGTLGGSGLGLGNTVSVVAGNMLVTANAGGDLEPDLSVSGNLTVLSGSDLNGSVDVGGNMILGGATNLGDGIGPDTFSVNGDLSIGGVTNVSAPLTTTSVVGGTLFVRSAGRLSFANGDDITWTVDAVDIFAQTGGGPPNGEIYLGEDNTLVVQGSFSGGKFDGTDTDGDLDNSLLAFVMPDNNSAFAPGPDTRLCDFSAFGNELTLQVTTSFEVQCNVYILDDSTLDLTDVLMRMVGDNASLSIEVDAQVTSTFNEGAVSFEGSGQTIDPVSPSTGHITSFIVNSSTNDYVLTTGPLVVDGIMSLANGGFDTGGKTVTFSGDNAGIIINTDGVNSDILGGTTLAGSWDLTYNGDNDEMGGIPGVEYHPTRMDDLTINTTDGPTQLNVPAGYVTQSASITGNFFVSGGSAPTVVDPLTVAGAGTVVGMVAAGGSTLTFSSGTPQAHAISGSIAAPTVFATDATVAGGGTGYHSGTVTFGGDVTVTAFQSYRALITILTGADLVVGFTDDDVATASIVGRDATVNGVSIQGNGSWTQTSYASQVGGTTFDVGNGTGVAGFDMGGFNFDLWGGSTFWADFNANIAQNGVLVAQSGGVTVNTNEGGTTDPADVLNFTNNDDGAEINGGFQVVGVTDINEYFDGGGFFIVSGTLHLGDSIGAPTTIIGTTVNVEGNQSFDSALTINATSVDFVEASVAAQSTLTINGLYTQTAGDVSYTDVHLFIESGLNYTAGTYTAGDANDEIVFNSASFNSNGGLVTIRTVRVSGGTLSLGQLLSRDMLLVEDQLFLNAGIQVGTGPFCEYPGDVTLGDGGGTFRTWGLGGAINWCNGTVNFGDTAMYDLAYGNAGYPAPNFGQTAVSGFEMPASFRELEINGAGTTAIGAGRAPTVDLLDLNGGIINGAANVETITIADGGTVAVGTNPAVALTNALGFAGDWTSNYEVAGNTVSAFDWPVGAVPTLFTTTHGAGTTTVGAPVRTAHNVTVSAGSTLDLAVAGLNVQGDLTAAGTVLSTGGGPLTFNGSAPQNTIGNITLPVVVMNNSTGLTLGGNMTVTSPAVPLSPVALTLTSGAIHTGAFVVTIPHGGTGFPGFFRPAAGGVVDGNVRKQILGGAPPMAADVMAFPTGTPTGSYRPAEVTLNDPSQVSGTAISGIFVTVNHLNTTPGGKNNMPLDTFRNKESSDPASADPVLPLRIARYSPFNWFITTSTTLSPSVSYDVALYGDGYAAFADENIERVRMIRRQGGNVNNFWQLVNGAIAANDNYSVSNTYPVAVVRNAVGVLESGSGALFTLGLESNMTNVAPADLVMNMGQSQVVDLTSVFGGGTPLAAPPPTYTYSSSAAKAAAAVSIAIVGDELTVSGVEEGTATITVSAVDDLNDSREVTFGATVNPVFMAGDIDDVELNVGGGFTTYTVDLATIFSGGTPPAGYAVTTSAGAVATATEAGGVLTVTAVAPGSTTIGVTATDQTGATASASFTADVNAAMGGSAIAGVDKIEGESEQVDLSTVFTGGDGTYTYAVSTDDTYIDASVSGGVLTATVVEAYDHSVNPATTIGTVDVEVTATDGIGDSAMATLTIDVFPVLGDLTGNGGPSPASAATTLGYWLGNLPFSLTAKQAGAADMDSDSDIDPFDASLNFQAFFGKDAVQAIVSSRLAFGEVSQDGAMIEIPIVIDGGDLDKVVSAGFIASIDPTVAKVVSVQSNLSEEWLVKHVVAEDGTLKIGVAGYGELTSDGTIATVTLQLIDRGAEFNLKAEGFVNNNAISLLDALELTELPETFALKGNYPNPFNPSTTIQFDLPESATVEIQIFDMLGRRAMVIPAQSIEAGVNRSIQLNASALASGSYFYRVIASMDSKTLVEQGRMMLVK